MKQQQQEEENKIFVQCQNCGRVFYIDKNVSVEELFVKAVCPQCGEQKALNCGNSIEDIYEFMNINLDIRYY